MAKGREEREEGHEERGAREQQPAPPAIERPVWEAVEAIGGGTLGWGVEVERLEKGVRLTVGRHSVDLDGELLARLRARLTGGP